MRAFELGFVGTPSAPSRPFAPRGILLAADWVLTFMRGLIDGGLEEDRQRQGCLTDPEWWNAMLQTLLQLAVIHEWYKDAPGDAGVPMQDSPTLKWWMEVFRQFHELVVDKTGWSGTQVSKAAAFLLMWLLDVAQEAQQG
ncbi:hypothetical protein JCM10207_001664 [Rhodosporidiobolus poonsookiae]